MSKILRHLQSTAATPSRYGDPSRGVGTAVRRLLLRVVENSGRSNPNRRKETGQWSLSLGARAAARRPEASPVFPIFIAVDAKEGASVVYGVESSPLFLSGGRLHLENNGAPYGR